MRPATRHSLSPTGLVVAGVFCAIAVFLIVYTWVPAPQALTREQGAIQDVISQPNTWYEARIVTDSGVMLTCRARKNPLAWAQRCPIEELERRIGTRVSVGYTSQTLYVIESNGVQLLGFDNYRSAQVTAIGIALLLIVMAYIALRRV